MTGETNEPAPAAELGIPGRVFVGLLVVAGLVAALTNPVGLITYIPFAGVGAILAIRRPRTSIGWILIGLAWCFANLPGGSPPLDARPEQFADGSLGWPARIYVLAHLLATNAFLLFALLASVLPSGRLPGGRWGRVVRFGLVLGLLNAVLSTVTPTIDVTLAGSAAGIQVRNPFAVLPDLVLWRVYSWLFAFIPTFGLLIGAAISLVVRYRRAFGVERQQLRWIGTSLIFVVLGVLAGFIVSILVPRSGESGLAWLGAIVAFPTVPIAIGVAVLRYRLYEIDTIINRAIVYGLLTAILAGGSAAIIGLTQRLFQGVVGPGSDAAIVLTTLMVVAAFNPIKNRLQTLVDRRFKEVHHPGADLESFLTEVRGSLSPPDVNRTLRRLLEVAVGAYRAKGGVVQVEREGTGTQSFRTGTVTGEAGLRASASLGELRAEIVLSGGDPSHEAEALQPALASVLVETTAGG